MESCSKELTLAIKLTKILSVILTQGKENVSANPTREFFQEVKDHLGSEVPAHVLMKTLFFLHRVTQKSYTQLLVTEQEYAIWLALHVLERNTWCKSLIFKSAQLALKVLTNLSLYLQQQELITDEERMSWQRCEKLLSLILLFIHKAQPLVPIECPSFLEASFPAYFISSVPEDFTMAYIEASLPSSNFDLFDEAYGAVKIFLNYILQVLRQTPYPTPLVSTLLSLLSSCPRLNETELFVTVLEAFRAWSSETNDFVHSAKLTILFSRINVSSSLISQKEVFQMLSHVLEVNESYVRDKGMELLPEEVLIDACSVIVEHLSSVQEQPKQPQNVNINGFGKEKFEEEENNSEEFCSFNRTGTNYEMQHWYYCYTCKLVANHGTCSVCARKCHKGHEIVYSRRGNFFCDCGANQGSNSCKSMPKGVKRRNINTRLLNREDLDLGIGMGASLEFREFLDRGEYFNEGHRSLIIPSQPLQGSMINFEEYSPDIHDMPEFSISSPAIDLPSEDDPSGSEDKKDFEDIDEEEEEDDEEDKDDLMPEMEIEDSESDLRQSSKSSVEVKKQKNEIVVQPRHINLEPRMYFELLEMVKRTLVRIGDIREPWGNFFGKKAVETSRSLSKHLCNFKAFSSLKSSYSEHKELKEIAAKYPGNRNSLAYCPDQNLILMAEGNKLLSIDSSLFQTNSTEVDRSNIQYLCKHAFSFQIMNVVRNPDNSRLLAVTGVSSLSCILLCSKQHRGYIEKKLTINITGSETKEIIAKVKWMPRSQTLIAVCTTEDLRIYDLSKDLLVPVQVFKSLENDLTDMIVDGSNFLVLSSKGLLFRQSFAVYTETRYLQETVSLNAYLESGGQKIHSIEWLDLYRLLFINLTGRILIIRPDSEFKLSLNEIFIDFSTDPNLSSHSCGISNIITIPSDDSLVCIGVSRKVSSTPILLKISENKAVIHSLKKTSGYADGICLYSQGNKNILLVQNDDGSLTTYSILKEEDTVVSTLDLETLNTWFQLTYLPKSVKMSVSFFEKCIVLNGMRVWGAPGVNRNDVVLYGDPIAVFGSSKMALEKLSFDRNNENSGIVSSMLADPKTVNITVALEGNSSNSLLISGFKIFMETGSGSSIELFNRKITSILAQKRWYDVPLCEAEILKGYLNKQITIKIHTPNPARHPIRLYNFEIFAINQSGYSLEQKLGELARIQSGYSSLQTLPAFYKQQSWKTRFSMIENLSYKNLIVFLNALSCTSIQPCSDLLEIIAPVSLQVFSSKVNVGIIALRQGLKALLQSMNNECAYIGAKALVICWTIANTAQPSEDCCKAALKALCKLAETSASVFAYVLKCYPQILSVLNEILTPNSKLKCIEQILNLLFAATELQVSPQAMDIYLQLFLSHSAQVKEMVISKSFAIIKKIGNFKVNFPRFDLQPTGDVLYQLGQIFNIKDEFNCKTHTFGLLKSIVETLCKNWSGELCKVNGILSLLHKIMVHLEKLYLRKEMVNSEVFGIITSAIYREIFRANCSAESQGRLFFLLFCNLLTSYSRPKEEKFSKVRKMHKSVVLAFVNTFPFDILSVVSRQLAGIVEVFKSGRGSNRAVYKNEFLVEVSELHSVARLSEPEDPLLVAEWEGVLDSEIFEQPNDQFLASNLVDFAFNLVSVSDSIESRSMDESFFEISADWKPLLLSVILEPSLHFVHSTSEKLLERLCGSHFEFLTCLNQAKIFNHFSVIQRASARNNCFKQFLYIESIFLLKELQEIKKCIVAAEESWAVISFAYIENCNCIQTLIQIALNLNDQVSEECLAIVNLILSAQANSGQLESCVVVLWEGFLEAVMPNLISKLSLSGNAELSRQAAELLSNISEKASGRVCRRVEELMLHYLEILPNLGSNSYHFIMNFIKIAGNSLYSQDLKEKFCQGVIRGLETSCKQLSSNVDNEIYEELQKLFSKYGFHWYLLEREPCLKCFDTNYTNLEQVKINDLQSEMRFSDSSYFVRFKNPIKVSKIDIKLSEIRGHKAVTGVSIYFCNQNNKDLAELKHLTQAWSLIKAVKVKPASTNTLEINLEIPIIMLNLMIKFETVAVIRLMQEDFPHFYQPRYITPRNRYSILGGKKSDIKGDVVGISMGNDKELMTCPRCSKTVEDKFGICTCGENAYQCFKCRNINYESLDAFLCNECGEGRYSKVDIFLKYALDAICESVTTDKEVQELGKEVDSHLGIIQSYYENLPKYRENLNSFIGKYKGIYSRKELKEENGKELSPAVYSLINTVREYQDAYYSMMISVKSVALLRTSIMHFSNPCSSVVSSQDLLTHCYGCNFNFISNILKGLKSLKNPELLNILIDQYNIIETTVQYIIHSYSQKLKKKGKKLIIQLALLNPNTIHRLYKIVGNHLHTIIQFQSFLESSVLEEIHLVLDFTCEYFSKKIDLSDAETASMWNTVLKEFWKIFFIVLKHSWQDSKVSNTLAFFLDMILDMIFKTLILKNSEASEIAADPETLKFFLDNPALYKTVESATNGSDIFVRCLSSVGIGNMYDDWQAGLVCYENWSIVEGLRVEIPQNWLLDCLLYSSSVRVQDMSRMIILCLAESGLWNDCLQLMLGMLPEALSICHQGADYYFTVLSRLLEGCTANRESILEILLTETDKSVKSILAQQEKAHARGTFIVNISLGHGLACLLHMLTDLTEIWGRNLLNSKKFVNFILTSFLNARKIQFVKNKVISESQEYLEKLFDHLHMDCSEEQRLNFLQECVRALVGCKNDLLAQIFLVQQIMRVIAPSKPEPLYYLRLEKSMTQEEFIRGNIEKNPYSSSEIGPLMADVRKRICKDLELADPDLLELLVVGQIVSPSLRIADVYEHVHWPHIKQANPKFASKRLSEFSPDELPQMMVTFRLAGLDGEATEDIVESIAAEDDSEIDLEQKYSISKILGQQIEGTSVIEYLLNLLKTTSSQELTDSTLNLLYYACQISTNRSFLCQIGGVPIFLTMLKSTKNSMQILKIIEILIADSSCQPYISSNSDYISLIINLLQSHKESLLEICPILPFLCHGNYEACTVLVNYFLSQVNIQDLKKLSGASAQIMEKMLESLHADHFTLRDAFLKSGVTKALCDQFTIIDAQSDPDGTKFLLKVLKGLVRSHFHSQQLLNPAIIDKIFKMKNEPNGIGPCAECLIESILHDRERSNPAVADLLEIMISDEDGQRREKANKKKAEILKQFQAPSIFDMTLEEEEGLTCVICKEGYKLRPDDLLGFYIYVTSVTQTTLSGEILHIMSTVTHFNPIHLQCHKEAARAEKSMRKPKTEWEGATIRNQHTKCNNWFPVWGPQIPRHDYAGGVQWMYSSYPTVENRLCNEIYNLKILVEKFAYEESFSKESRGGGPEHNMQAIPYVLQLIFYLAEEDKGYFGFFMNEQKEMMGKLQCLKPCTAMLAICANLVCGCNEWAGVRSSLVRECWGIARSNMRNEIKVQSLVSGTECTNDQKMILSTYKAFLIAIRIVDLILTVLFANNFDPVSMKSFLQSASADIQDRSLFIYEDYRKLISMQSVQEILSHIGFSDFAPSWFS